MAGLIGALRVSLSADTAAFQRGMTAAERKAASSASAIQRSLGGIKTAAMGLLTGIQLGTLASLANEALDFAASFTEVSKSAGITVEQLQILTRAAMENGATQDQVVGAMQRLNAKLGEAQAGAKEAVKTFEQLGISKDQIDSFRNAGDALPYVMEGIKNLKTESLQAAGAKRVFGKAFAPLLPMLVQGADGYNQMADAAREAGLITTEQAERADNARDRIDLLAYTLKTNLTAAFLDQLPAIEGVANAIGNLIGMIAKLQQQMGFGLPDIFGGLISSLATIATPLNMIFGKKVVPAVNKPGPTTTGTRTMNLATGGGGGRKKGRGGGSGKSEAERAAEKAARAQYQFEQDQRRNQIDILRAQSELTEDYSLRTNNAHQILLIEQQMAVAANVQSVKTSDMTQARADALDAQEAIVFGLRQERNHQEEQTLRAQEVQSVEDERFDQKMAALQHDRNRAQTASEQRGIEMRILKATYEYEKLKLQLNLAEAQRLDDAKAAAEAERALKDLDANQQRLVEDAMDRTKGPLDQFLSTLPDTAAKANEAFEAVAANGLQSVVDGLTDAITGAKSLGEVFKNVAKQIIADLIRIGVQRALAGLLGQGGQPSGGGGGGGFFASFMGGSGGGGGLSKSFSSGGTGTLKGFARGGSFMVGGRGGTDRNVLGINGMAVARVGHGEMVSIKPDNDNSGRIAHIVPSPYFDAVVDGRVVRTASPMAQGAAQSGSADARNKLSRQQSRRLP